MNRIVKYIKPKNHNLRRKCRLYLTGITWLYVRFIMWQPSKHVRRWLMNMFPEVRIAKGVPINHNCEWWLGPLEIGEGSTIGFHCQLDCRRGLKIGKNVCLASGVWTWTLHHDYNSIDFKAVGGCIEIGDYAWLCSRCTILPGVKIGEGAIIASGAVVTKDVEPWTVVGGIPAKPIGKREQKNYNYSPGLYWVPLA